MLKGMTPTFLLLVGAGFFLAGCTSIMKVLRGRPLETPAVVLAVAGVCGLGMLLVGVVQLARARR